MRLYKDLAEWWPLLSHPDDYLEEAELFWKIISKYKRNIDTALELGAGGGNNAYHLKKYCHWTLTDLSTEMLAISKKLNPECEHLMGDMRTLDLDREFDLVLIHDAIMYMTSTHDLEQVFRLSKKHLKPDGLMFLIPDFFRETFRSSTDHGGHDEGEKSLRYLEWSFDPDPEDDTIQTEYVYMIREGLKPVEVIHDHSVEGIFSREVWKSVLERCGFDVIFERIDHSTLPSNSYSGMICIPGE